VARVKKGKKRLRKRAWVKVDFDNIGRAQLEHYEKHRDERFIYLGEIPNRAGHSLVLSLKEGGINVVVFHTEELIELTEDET
jgi:hypothetical protein